MKKSTLLLMAGTVIIMVFAIAAYAGDEEAEQSEKQPIEFKEQTHCPVMGGKIDKEVYTDIQGQRVYHCCPGCKQTLVDDPDTYFEKAAAERVVFENIQTACPICGKEITGEISTYFEGRTVKFCCEKCSSKFDAEPQMYLSMLGPGDKELKNKMQHDEKKHKEHEEHKGHNH